MDRCQCLQSEKKCLEIQKMVYRKIYPGRAVNSYKPWNEPGEYVREDGVIYRNDICYGEKYPNSYLDIFYCDGDRQKKKTTILYIHGGGFFMGDKVSGDPLTAGEGRDVDFAVAIAKRGYNVVLANYALTPQYRFPTQLEQVDQMLVHLTEHQDEYGLDMNRVFLGGGSAGADLTEIYGALLTVPEYAEHLGIRPSIDKKNISGLLIDEATLSVRNFEENMNAMLGCWMGQDNLSASERALDMDPTRWIKDVYIPSFINSSNQEIWFKDSAEDLTALLEKNGTPYEYFYRGPEFGKLEHGYMQQFESNPCARECFEHMMLFIRKFSNHTLEY